MLAKHPHRAPPVCAPAALARALLLAVVAAAPGCECSPPAPLDGGDGRDHALVDGPSVDAAVLDANHRDRAAHDMNVRDGAFGDVAGRDTALSDSGAGDMASRDVADRDAVVGDGAASDSVALDHAVLDRTATDSVTADSTAADSTVPDSTAADSTVPDSTAPDSTAPDSTAADNLVAGPDAATAFDSALPGDAGPLPVVEFAVSTSTVHESSSPARVVVVLDRPSAAPVLVPFTAASLSAQLGVDLDLRTASPLVFAPGETTLPIELAIVDDSQQEPAESIALTLQQPQGALLGAGYDHLLFVADNDDVTWPGAAAVTAADNVQPVAGNWSGLTLEPSGALWAVRNGPSELFRLRFDGSSQRWNIEAAWTLTFPGKRGAPDAEGVTKAGWQETAVYVAVERDNNNSGVSRTGVLRFDTISSTATHEWNLTHDAANGQTLDVSVGANGGLEAITWVPDVYLEAHHFYDETLVATYSAAAYPNHGTGLFLVGLESNGRIYVYALSHTDSSFDRLGSFASGLPQIMGLEFDRESGYLWAHCDNSCANASTVLVIEETPGSAAAGRFVVRHRYQRPAGLPDSNFEGIAVAPEASCVDSTKKMIWADDSNFSGVTLREGSIPCGAFSLSP